MAFDGRAREHAQGIQEKAQLGLFAALLANLLRRKQAEEALRQSEERLRLALEATTDAIWDWDLTTQETFCSPRWYTMLGYPAGDARANLTVSRALIHPDDSSPGVSRNPQYGAGVCRSAGSKFTR